MLLFYIRHGDPDYEHDSLTPLGKEQAKALAKRLMVGGVDKVFASPFNRAQMTAEPFCSIMHKEITVCDWADEGKAGDDFYLSTEEGCGWCFQLPSMVELFNTPAVRNLGDKWYEHPDFAKYNFAAGIQRINEGVDGFMESLGLRHDRENARFEVIGDTPERVAVFAHQGVGMLFFGSLLDIPYPMFCTHFDFGHSSMTVVDFKQRGKYIYPRVLQLSNDSHQYREGILTGYNNMIKF